MKIVFSILGGIVIGFLIADFMALNFAKKHGVIKYGGLFSNEPKAGAIQ